MSSKTPPNYKRIEMPDQTPVSIPSGFRRPPTLQEQIRSLIRHEGYQQAVNSGIVESIDEADDFDVDDEEFPSSKWEYEADEADFRALARAESQAAAIEQKRAAQRSKSKKATKVAPKSPDAPEADTDEE